MEKPENPLLEGIEVKAYYEYTGSHHELFMQALPVHLDYSVIVEGEKEVLHIQIKKETFKVYPGDCFVKSILGFSFIVRNNQSNVLLAFDHQRHPLGQAIYSQNGQLSDIFDVLGGVSTRKDLLKLQQLFIHSCKRSHNMLYYMYSKSETMTQEVYNSYLHFSKMEEQHILNAGGKIDGFLNRKKPEDFKLFICSDANDHVSGKSNGDTFYMNFTEGRTSPTHKHKDYAGALNEAKRLAENQMRSTYVLKAVTQVNPDLKLDIKTLE